MTIRKGEPWGTMAPRPPDLYVARCDRELSIALEACEERPLGVASGDLHRSIGAPPARDPLQALPIDVLAITVDGLDTHLAVAHVVLRRGWWRGRIVAAAKVDHLGEWNIAPRAHPNDGRIHVVEVASEMGIRQRLLARRRLPNGSHVPHPDIAVRTSDEVSWSFARPHRLYVDGERIGAATDVTVTIRPDAATVYA